MIPPFAHGEEIAQRQTLANVHPAMEEMIVALLNAMELMPRHLMFARVMVGVSL
ncbi:hypothetical protein D3C80_1992750 [compost metagenome]